MQREGPVSRTGPSSFSTGSTSVEDAVEDAADDEAPQDAADQVVPSAAATAAAPTAATPLIDLLLGAGGVDVALGVLQCFRGQHRHPASRSECLLACLLRCDHGRHVGAQSLGLGEPGAGIGPDPPAVTRDEAAGDAELAV